MSEYLSAVAGSGQVNTPPGSYATVKEWIMHSFLGPQANVLEIGCSMGFISIEIARYVKATCTGLDLHEASIEAARLNIDRHVADKVSFVQGNAGKLSFSDGTFSHTIIGGHLPFCPPTMREQHVHEAVRVTEPWGYVLVALYFYKAPPPHALVDEFNREIGTNLDPSNDRGYWNGLFEVPNLILEHESVYDVLLADSERMQQYVSRLSASKQQWGKYLRLFNENGSYLSYFVRVYRKLPNEQGLMIQVPRGGLYQSKQISARTL